MTLQKWLLIPDSHIPYVDTKVFSLMLRAARSAGIKNVCILGDFIDCYTVSSFGKDPTRKQDLQSEIDATNEILDVLDKMFTGEKKYIAGNHEDRLERYLIEKAPALFNTVKIERLLKLKERGWQYTPYKRSTRIGKLYVTHDAGKAGKNAAADALNAFQGNVVIGHTHRINYLVEGNAKGKAHVGAMFGWLGDFEAVDYLHRIRCLRDWAHGFGVAYVEDNGCVHLTPVPIVNGRVVLEGKLIR